MNESDRLAKTTNYFSVDIEIDEMLLRWRQQESSLLTQDSIEESQVGY